jgi:hypothetical protein
MFFLSFFRYRRQTSSKHHHLSVYSVSTAVITGKYHKNGASCDIDDFRVGVERPGGRILFPRSGIPSVARESESSDIIPFPSEASSRAPTPESPLARPRPADPSPVMGPLTDSEDDGEDTGVQPNSRYVGVQGRNDTYLRTERVVCKFDFFFKVRQISSLWA